jgi:uncharacterized membrane protein
MKGIAGFWFFFVFLVVGWLWVSTNADVSMNAMSAVQASQLYDGASLTVLCVIAVTVALMWGGMQPVLDSLEESLEAKSDTKAPKVVEEGGKDHS